MGKFEKSNRPQAGRSSSSYGSHRQSSGRTARSSGSSAGYYSHEGTSRRASSGAGQRSPKQQPQRRRPRKKQNKAPLIVGIAGALLVIGACTAGFFILRGNDSTPESFVTDSSTEVLEPEGNRIISNAFVAGVPVGDMTREEALAALHREFPSMTPSTGTTGEDAQSSMVSFGNRLQNMEVRLYTDVDNHPFYVTTYDISKEHRPELSDGEESTPAPADPTEKPSSSAPVSEHPAEKPESGHKTDKNAPLDENGLPYRLERTLCIPAADVKITFDAEKAVEAAYQYGRSTKATGKKASRIDIDIREFMNVEDNGYISDVLQLLEEDKKEGAETTIRRGKTSVYQDDGTIREVDCLNITLGAPGRRIDLDALREEIIRTYMVGSSELEYMYDETYPKPVDLDRLFRENKCKAPINAVLDKETFEVTKEKVGWGFLMYDAVKSFASAKSGDTVTLTLTDLQPKFTQENLESKLYTDVLATKDTAHTWQPARTHNLELACEAINGTVVYPGDVFSFNDTVGERTADKGYGEAGVYVGGKTENQLGGGVCQVASTLYWCTLKADLEVVKRAEHQFTPSYIEWGMDATVYYGYLDYQFRNTTPYPIRIDASVSDGYVHITFMGTETRDYTTKLYYDIVGCDPSETKTIYIHPSMDNYSKYSGYSNGSTIQTAYDGYTVNTYRQRLDADGNVIEEEKVNTSRYDRRDREVACVLDPDIPMNQQVDGDGNLIKPTEPETTQPETTEPTEPETEPTDPPTEPEPPTETDPPTEPEPPTEAQPTETAEEPEPEPEPDL